MIAGSECEWIGHEGGAIINAISALIKETQRASLPLPKCEDMGKMWLSVTY